MNIVQTNIKYTYSVLKNNLHALMQNYPFLNVESVGKSVLGKNIYVVKLGVGPHQVFYSASIHGNEWITSILLVKFIEVYCEAYTLNSKLYGYFIRDIFNSSSIYLMPMVNPDGVDLVIEPNLIEANSLKNVTLISNKFPNIPFPLGWKANIRGVDLKIYQPIINPCNNHIYKDNFLTIIFLF